MPLSTVPRYVDRSFRTRGERAVVIGAGIAGLLAARVLADGFDHVTVFERDALPDAPRTRSGVPQAAHVHAMLEAGRVTLEALFPGFGADVEATGGVVIDAATEFHYFHDGDFLADGPEPLPMLCATRPLIEHVVRDRLTAVENVALRPRCRFTDYRLAGSDAIDGVRIARGNGEIEAHSADLVIDATGRPSRTPRFLDRNGFSSPTVDSVTIDLAYGTAVVRRPAGAEYGFLVGPTPSQPVGGTAVPVEGGRWIVTLFGLHGHHPPTDRDGFLAFAKALPTDDLYALLDTHAWETDEIARYPFPSSRRHRYEDLDRFPTGLLPIGDAIASFNPIYGQGMSVAALSALELHHVLSTTSRQHVAQTYFDRVSDLVSLIWRMTVSADFGFERTRGPKPMGTDVVNWYLSRLIRTAHADGHVSDAFARVLRLERHPLTLCHPRILARLARSR